MKPAWRQQAGAPRLDLINPTSMSIFESLLSHQRWSSAINLAELTGKPWPVVASRLAQLVNEGWVEAELVEVTGKARTVEQTRRYRARPLHGQQLRVESTMPSWLAPQVIIEFGERRRVDGIAGMRRHAKVARPARADERHP
jgi:hypothetical protein